MNTILKAGIACRDISPKPGIPLGGYPHYPRHNTGIHDPLHASCMYLFDGKTEAVIAALDILFFSKQYVKRVRQGVYEQCGIPQGNIMISCSHTHSGPWAAGGVDGETLYDNEDADYVAELISKLVSMIVEAKHSAFDAMVGVTKGICGPEQGIGGNRRDPKGPADTDVCLIAVKDQTGVMRGIYTNYALHPTVLHEDNKLVSADFPGYTRHYIKQLYPHATLIYTQGASGNQSSRYFRQGQSFDEAMRIGYEIGKAANQALEQLLFQTTLSIDTRSTTVKIKTRQVPPIESLEKEVERYRLQYEAMKADNKAYIDVQNANLKHLGAEDFLTFAFASKSGKLRLLNEEDPAEIQVISIGDARIVGLPGELFVDFALDIKKRSPYPNTFVATIANGCLPGYVCTRDAYELGGYETGASFMDSTFGYDMVELALSLL